MKHNAFTALSLAAALVVAGSAQATEFSMNFESGTALPATEGTWTVPTGDASEVIATPSGAPAACQTKVLSLDTGDDELNFAPTSQNVTILEMDVCFVGADSAPDTTGFNGQTMLYLDVSGATPVVKAYTAGSGWVSLTGSVADGSWHTVRMEFSASAVAFFLDGTAAGTATLSSFTKVTSVGFKGTGMVDNFVGDKAGIPGATDSGNGETAGNSASYVNGVVTGDFSTTDLKFIRVYNGNNYVTLRYTDSQAVTLPANFGTPTKVVAYYGDEVSAIPDNMTSVAATTVEVEDLTDDGVDNPTINVSLTGLVSGLYYKAVSPDEQTVYATKLVAPAEDGTSATLTIAPEATAWGVKKFKLIVVEE